MNSTTQNRKITAITEKTMIIGIDVGSETHFARAFDWRGYEFSRKPLEFSNTEEGFEMLRTWIEDLKEKHGMEKVKLGVEGVNRIWRDAKVRGVGIKRAKTLVTAAEHSIGCREAQEAARIELKILLLDYEMQTAREAELMAVIEEKITKVPYVDKLLEIKGIGMKTVVGFVAEVGDIKRFDDPKQLQKLAGYAIVKNASGKHKGESHISYRGRKRLRYVLYEAAVSLVSHNPEFKSIHQYYTTRERTPLKKMQSMIAVACKLIRVFYLILRTGATYDAAKLMGKSGDRWQHKKQGVTK